MLDTEKEDSMALMGKVAGFALVLIACLAAVCPAPTLAAPISIALNNTMSDGGSEEASMKRFKEIVEQKSKGQLIVNLFLSSQLGGENAVLSLLRTGRTEMALTGTNFLTQYTPEYNAVNIPYLLEWKQQEEYLLGPFGKTIGDLSSKKGGMLFFAPQYRGARQMTTNRPIREVSDVKGLKIRVPENPVFIRLWKQLGALPVSLPASEIYMAMQTGQVEAHENTLVSPYSRSLWEVQKYVVLTSHVLEIWCWAASEVWFRKLSAEHQGIIREAIEEARQVGGQWERDKEGFYLDELKKRGMTILTPNVESFKKAAAPIIQDEIKRLHPDAQKEVAKYVRQ
jgi:TRAP-type transport system periplasmic protein